MGIPDEREARADQDMRVLPFEAADFLAAIVASSDDAIVSKNLSGVITTWNKGAERIFGYTADEAVGQPITIVIPEDRKNEEPSILSRIQAGERVDHFETVRRRKDGTLIDISLTISPIVDSRGRIIGAAAARADRLEIVWLEANGPMCSDVPPASSSGFGRILEATLSQSLNARIERTWMPAGVSIHVTLNEVTTKLPGTTNPGHRPALRIGDFDGTNFVGKGCTNLHDKTERRAMPRYFFHVRDAEGLSEDTEGTMLSNDERAYIEAAQAAREMLAEKILKDEIVDGAEFEVVRGDGVLVTKIPLKSVVRFE